MNKVIGFSMCLALVIALGAEAKRVDFGVKSKLSTQPKAAIEKVKPARTPAAAEKKAAPVQESPLLYDTATPQWANPRGNDGYSCEAATAYYGKTCTSRFLSF